MTIPHELDPATGARPARPDARAVTAIPEGMLGAVLTVLDRPVPTSSEPAGPGVRALRTALHHREQGARMLQ